MLKFLALAVAGEARAAIKREATAAAFFALAAVVFTLAAVFAALGARDWLTSLQLSQMQASFLVATALAVLALIVVAIGVYQRRRRSEPSPLAAGAILAAPMAAGALGRKVNLGTLAAVAAIVAGAYFGRQIGRR